MKGVTQLIEAGFKNTRQLVEERDQLRAEVERLRRAVQLNRDETLAATDALRELREAAEKLNKYLTEQEDAEWLNFACLDVNQPAVVQFRAVLAKG